MELLDSLNRTIKLAMDEGRVDSLEQAQQLFDGFRVHLVVAPGFSSSPAAQAAVLTMLVAAPKTFLGGVEISGAVEERCTMAWYAGASLAEVAISVGARVTMVRDATTPRIFIGREAQGDEGFSISMDLRADGFTLSPEAQGLCLAVAPVEVGVAVAGAALNEAFQYLYAANPLAGQRRMTFRMPATAGSAPRSYWLVGLGHLGQALLWTAVLAAGSASRKYRLTDFDTVTASSLSTGLLVRSADIGRKKVEVASECLSRLGFVAETDPSLLTLEPGSNLPAADVAIIAVDNLALRRSLDHLRGMRVVEAGIGGGATAFTRVQLHEFPGPRMARDIWANEDPRASTVVDISAPAYQRLLQKSGDLCGTALLAGRSIATPFVGAFAGAVLYGISHANVASDLHSWAFDLRHL